MGSRCFASLFSKLIVLCAVAALPVTAGCAVIPVTRPVVKIGLVAPFEGQYRYVGYDAINAARLALREANAADLLDVSVELVPYDDRGAKDAARTAARNLTEDDQVVAVIGHFLDETTSAAEGIYEAARIPMIVAGTVAGATLDPYFDALCPLLEYAESAAVEGDEQVTFPLKIQWMAKEGSLLPDCSSRYEIVTSRDLPPKEGVDIILLTGDPISAGETFVALRDVNWRGQIVGGPSLSSPLFRDVAENPQDVVFITPSRFPDTSDVDFSERFLSVGPHVPEPGPFALTTYRAVDAILEAMQQAERQGESPSRGAVGRHLDFTAKDVFYIYRWAGDGTAQVLRSGIVLNAN